MLSTFVRIDFMVFAIVFSVVLLMKKPAGVQQALFVRARLLADGGFTFYTCKKVLTGQNSVYPVRRLKRKE